MSSAATPGGDDPLAQATAAEMDARFSAIVTGLSGQLNWDLRSPAEDGPDETVSSGGPTADAHAAERARRRELRRLERAAELATFEAEQVRRSAEYEADDAHFVPPDPPPVPRPRRRTVAALVMLAAAILLVARPTVLPAPTDLVVATSLVLLLGALALFGASLRHRSTDPQDGEGWDDGARL